MLVRVLVLVLVFVLVLVLVLVLVIDSPARADDPAPIDFSAPIHTPKLARAEGRRPVLAILWDPHRPEHPAPPRAIIDSLLFGKEASVADWFRENSNGKLSLERAGVLGWYDAEKPADHYWGSPPEHEPGAANADGFSSGHAEKWAEAIRRADREFDFARYDANKDGRLDSAELAILVVIPQEMPYGSVRDLAGRQVPALEALVVDGVSIPSVSEWYTGAPPNFGAAAHELCHLLLGAPDLYMNGHWAFSAGDYSLMDHSYATVHLDPFEKLKLGWASPVAVSATAACTLRAVETTGEMLVLYDPRRGVGEYLIVENRWRGASYDRVRGQGLAVWHVIEDPRLFALARPPTGGPEDWGRRGIRLIRANGGTIPDDTKALLDRRGARLTDDTAPARLRWIDGSRTGFSVELLSDPGPEVRVQIDRKP